MKSVLVTGGAGFIGRYVLQELLARGLSVVSYDRDFIPAPGHSGIATVQGELYDIPALLAAIRSHDVGAVIHTAGQSHPGHSIDRPLPTFVANLDGTLHVFEAVRLARDVRVINFSSECVYGDSPGPIDEASALDPLTPYGVSKVAGELLARSYVRHHGLDIISLRIAEVYGPGLRMPEVMNDMIKTVVVGTSFDLPSGVDHPFHFVHAQDVARAAVAACVTGGLAGRSFNICAGEQTTLGRLAAIVRERLPEARIDLGAGYLPAWDRQGPWLMEAARKELGFAPTWTLRSGVSQLIDHHLEGARH